jgi:hypothetical protein
MIIGVLKLKQIVTPIMPGVPSADSTACRAAIPRDAGPGFHGKPGHRSAASRAG